MNATIAIPSRVFGMYFLTFYGSFDDVCSSNVFVPRFFLCSDANIFSSKGFSCVNTVNCSLA